MIICVWQSLSLLVSTIKEPTQALLDLRAHYLFSHRFCNARKGNEKGHVERSVEYIRRKAFALKGDFTDLASHKPLTCHH